MKKAPIIIFCLILIFEGSLCFAETYSYGAVRADVRILIDGREIIPEREIVGIGGRLLVPARSIFSTVGAKVDWYEQNGTVLLTRGAVRVSMVIGSRYATINYQPVTSEIPPILVRETVMVPVRFVAEAFGLEIQWLGDSKAVAIGSKPGNAVQPVNGGTSRGDFKNRIVVIDPGHGGVDPGAVYGGVREKDLNLDISLRLNKLLKEAGVKTYMTRTKDTYVGLYERSAYANCLKADLFVSIHNNAGMMATSGSMSLYYPTTGSNRFTGKDLAAIVQKKLVVKLGTRDLGIIPRNQLVVLRTTSMPAVIAEIGYVTNPAELSRLKTESFRQKAAEALRDAILEALAKL